MKDRLLRERMENVFALTVDAMNIEISDMLEIVEGYLETSAYLRDWNYALPKAIMYIVMEGMYKKFSPSKGDEWFYAILEMRRDTKPKNILL